MAFTDHKITAFQKKLTDLPDQPNLSAAELKAYFDSSPEELRQALNGVCADASRLDDRVSGIVAGTFGDAIPKAMLSSELQAELDAKAEATALAAETETLKTQINTLAATKCEVYIGTYEGDGEASHTITLQFPIKAVLIFNKNGLTGWYNSGYTPYSGGLAMPGWPSKGITVEGNTFTVHGTVEREYFINNKNQPYYFLVFH